MARSQLKLLLTTEDITAKQLASASGLPYDTIVKICNGRRPQIDNAYEITDGLNALIGRRKYRIDDVFPDLYTYAQKQRYKHG